MRRPSSHLISKEQKRGDDRPHRCIRNTEHKTFYRCMQRIPSPRPHHTCHLDLLGLSLAQSKENQVGSCAKPLTFGASDKQSKRNEKLSCAHTQVVHKTSWAMGMCSIHHWLGSKSNYLSNATSVQRRLPITSAQRMGSNPPSLSWACGKQW